MCWFLGHVLGLVNLGYTCFLNTLLQALASCPVVLDWLSMHQNNTKQNAMTLSLLRTLQGKWTRRSFVFFVYMSLCMCNRQVRFDVLDVRLYIWSSHRFMISPGLHYNWGELVFWRLVWLPNSRVVNNARGFLERWKHVKLTFCKEPFCSRTTGWTKRHLTFVFFFITVRTEMTARSLICIIFSSVGIGNYKRKWSQSGTRVQY